MAWNTAIYRIRSKITNDIGFTKRQQAIVAAIKRVKGYQKQSLNQRCGSAEELQYFSERGLYLVLPELGLIDAYVGELFFEVIGKLRNFSAHPTGHKPVDGQAIFVIQSVLQNVMNNQKMKLGT